MKVDGFEIEEFKITICKEDEQRFLNLLKEAKDELEHYGDFSEDVVRTMTFLGTLMRADGGKDTKEKASEVS